MSAFIQSLESRIETLVEQVGLLFGTSFSRGITVVFLRKSAFVGWREEGNPMFSPDHPSENLTQTAPDPSPPFAAPIEYLERVAES